MQSMMFLTHCSNDSRYAAVRGSQAADCCQCLESSIHNRARKILRATTCMYTFILLLTEKL